MKILQSIDIQEVSTAGIRISLSENSEELGHAFVYILKNDLHKEPFGFLEDVFVEQDHRGKGLGTTLVMMAIDEAKKRGCYKLVGTSRGERCAVHAMYKKLGFRDYGKEFRMDFS